MQPDIESSYRIHRGNPDNEHPDANPDKGFAGGRLGYWLFTAIIFGIVLPCGAAAALVEKLTRPSGSRRTPLHPM